MNISGTLNAFKVLRDPSLCLPHCTISTFNQLPIPLSRGLRAGKDEKEPDIRAVVLDKDNCFAIPHQNTIHGPFQEKFRELRNAYPGSRLLIVSNTAGTLSDSKGSQARLLEANTGVKVLRHNTKKPGCHDDVMKYFRGVSDVEITHPSQIAIVGDRLLTDMMMANMMGSFGVWTRNGATLKLGQVEGLLADFLTARGYQAPKPTSPFE